MEPHLPVRVRTYYRLGSIVLQYTPNWRKVFNQASAQQKKMMLRTIIGRVDVFRDEIKVHFKLKTSQFIGTMGVEVENQVDVDKVIE